MYHYFWKVHKLSWKVDKQRIIEGIDITENGLKFPVKYHRDLSHLAQAHSLTPEQKIEIIRLNKRVQKTQITLLNTLELAHKILEQNGDIAKTKEATLS